MAIHWRLKTYLATRHKIYQAAQLQRRVAKQTGILISRQNLGNYLNQKPKIIRLKTLEIICTALGCRLQDICEIIPSESILKKAKASEEIKKLSWHHTPHCKRAVKNFPDPQDYKS